MKVRFWSAVGLVVLGAVGTGIVRSAASPGAEAAPLEVVPVGELSVPRATHQAVLLETGRVLIAGGCAGRCDRVLSSAELYDPAMSSFAPAADMETPRHKIHDAVVVLPSGEVLVLGGYDAPVRSLASAWVIRPAR